MIDERSWKNKNRDRDQMNVDERKRFENLKKKRFENLDENLDDELENDFKNANFMNIKFVNLHVIFSFSI
jgi:hypothetical protein